MRLFVGIPWSSPFFFSQTALSLLQLQHPPGWQVQFGFGEGFCPARRHNHLCEQALAAGAAWVCILGADQLYEPDLLCRLVQRVQEGYPVVSALVPCRGFVSWQPMRAFQPMAWRFKAGNLDTRQPYTSLEASGDLLEVIQPHTGMQRIDFIGSGVLLFHRDHLLALRQPWFFETITGPNYRRRASMDCTMVWRLQTEAHTQVWCDTDIPVRHLHVFPIDQTYSDRFADWEHGEGQPDPRICHYREGAAHGQEEAYDTAPDAY